ncbi:MAG: 2-phospho-L-lactate guanylyltransferase, partial [Sciscionella sp.]
ISDATAHAELALALATDTVTAAALTKGVRRIVVVSADARVRLVFLSEGVEVLDEQFTLGLNAALLGGFSWLREQDRGSAVGALQADLPALRPAHLAAALAEAQGRRAYCADRNGSGTTLLLAAAGGSLDPMFGPGSAMAHAASNATPITASVPSLRCDVDTVDDLTVAAELGLGSRTSALLSTASPVC